MTGQRVQSAIEKDFDAVWQYLANRPTLVRQSQEGLRPAAKTIHRSSYSLILWRFRLKSLPARSSVFLDEVASDALQVLPQTLAGYTKTTKLLLRSVIENVLRHVYFSDHPVEFDRLNRDAKWYLSVEQLVEYARHHSALMNAEARFDALNQLTSLYSELSAGVHGRRVRDLELKTALETMICSDALARDIAQTFRKCAQACNFVLSIFHQPAMRRFQTEDRRIILRSLPPIARQAWIEHE